jgi:hypothetical protein
MPLAPLFAALALVAVHFVTPKLRFLSNRPRSIWLSFAGGASLAYVFLHLLPEIAHGQEVLAQEAGGHGALLGFEVWGVALAALLAFYGIERMIQREAIRRGAEDEEDEPGIYRVHLTAFVLYNFVTGYLLVDRMRGEDPHGDGLLVFAIAMALHLLITDFGLVEAFRDGYLRLGRWLLSGAVLAGWAIGAASELPNLLIEMTMAALGGAVILNVLKEELPAERESRFWALLLGVGAFALLVLLE